jgi:hypothetical protein
MRRRRKGLSASFDLAGRLLEQPLELVRLDRLEQVMPKAGGEAALAI